jgi:hypothetical protein
MLITSRVAVETKLKRNRVIEIEHLRTGYDFGSHSISPPKSTYQSHERNVSGTLEEVAPSVERSDLYTNVLIPVQRQPSEYAGRVWPGESAYQTSGFSLMNLSIRALHSSFSNTTTSTPRSFKYFSPPTKVLFSPITTRRTLYRMHAPVHMSHGERVVYIVAPSYAVAGSRPEFWRADISA